MEESPAEPKQATEALTAPPSNPVMDVVAPPPVDKTDPAAAAGEPEQAKELPPETAHDKKATTQAPAKPKQATPGVGLAIGATVIIILGIAALATYAYLKTAK